MQASKPAELVPAARFFALFGYTVFAFLLLAALLEVGSFLAITLRRSYAGPADAQRNCRGGGCGRDAWLDMASSSPAFEGYSWAEDFWRDERARYHKPYLYAPFRLWQEPESHSRYVNIDWTPTGNWRRTPFPSVECKGRPPLRVWVLGGSAAWGTGVPDFATIPSYLSQKLAAEGSRCVDVSNFAVEGYVSNQELITLVDLLKQGGRPDVVILYDGYNDADCGVYSPGLATGHCGLVEIKGRFEARGDSLVGMVRNSYSLQVIRALLRRLSSQPEAAVQTLADHNRLRPQQLTPAEVDRRARAALSNYTANLCLLRQLAAGYNFRPYAFWQPTLFYGDKPLSGFERGMRQYASQQHGFQQTLEVAYGQAEAQAKQEPVSFFFLARSLDSIAESLYVDFVHLGPRGNELIADAIARQLVRDHVLSETPVPKAMVCGTRDTPAAPGPAR